MTTAPYRSSVTSADDGFGRLLLAEWTKLRSVLRWTLALLAAVVLTVLLGLSAAAGISADEPEVPSTVGPDGKPVRDGFQFLHGPLSANGELIARVEVPRSVGQSASPWSKAGIMVKAQARAGSEYAAMMVTPGHGVRFQSNFTHDVGAGGGSGPRWLRLTRSGATITGYVSADGRSWNRVGSTDLQGLQATAEAGLFVAAPDHIVQTRAFGSTSRIEVVARTTATFTDVTVRGGPPAAQWRSDDLGPRPPEPGTARPTANGFTLTGFGDIAPHPQGDERVRVPLTGAIIGLILVAALGVQSVTSEYRRGMIRTTFTASPRRGRVLAAKAIVVGAVTFVAGLVASLIVVPAAQPLLSRNGYRPPVFPAPELTDPAVLRAVLGTALVLALAAVLSVAAGAITRHSASAITAVIVLFVLPTVVVGALPLTAAEWVLRLTPAAGFSIQQAVDRYDHVETSCLPDDGCSFEQPWAGLGVLVAYTAVGLALAYRLIRRRDV